MGEGYCPMCLGTGEWENECCNGAGGCSCRGQMVPMGRCQSCRGTGVRDEHYNPEANYNAIRGYGFIGTGPRPGSVFDGVPRLGYGSRP